VSFRNEHDRTSIGSDLPPITLEDYHRSAGEAPVVPQERPERVSVPTAPPEQHVATWRQQAACFEHPNKQLWLKPPDGGLAAEEVCHTQCPVQQECLAWFKAQPQYVKETHIGMVMGGYTWQNDGTRKRRTKSDRQKVPKSVVCVGCGSPFKRVTNAKWCLDCRTQKREARKPGECRGCGLQLNRKVHRSDTEHVWCSNACAMRTRYWENLESERARQRARYRANAEREREAARKRRAAKKAHGTTASGNPVDDPDTLAS
jgi:hypothetical protein